MAQFDNNIDTISGTKVLGAESIEFVFYPVVHPFMVISGVFNVPFVLLWSFLIYVIDIYIDTGFIMMIMKKFYKHSKIFSTFFFFFF